MTHIFRYFVVAAIATGALTLLPTITPANQFCDDCLSSCMEDGVFSSCVELKQEYCKKGCRNSSPCGGDNGPMPPMPGTPGGAPCDTESDGAKSRE